MSQEDEDIIFSCGLPPKAAETKQPSVCMHR